MLRRRDVKGSDEITTDGGAAEAASAQGAAPGAAGAENATANITPGGLAWKPMRQTNETWDARSAGVGEESVIGPDDFFNGEYRSERGVRVQGRVEGSIESKGHILIEDQAQVIADLHAQDITVAGRYNGKVECRRRFEITPSGVVTGEINTDLLVVHEGGYFDGKLKMKDRATSGRSAQPQPSSEDLSFQAAPTGLETDETPAHV